LDLRRDGGKILSELFLSSLIKRYKIVAGSSNGQFQARLVDFILETLNGDYPRIKSLLLQTVHSPNGSPPQNAIPLAGGNFLSALPWECIEAIDWTERQIRVHQVEAILPVEREAIAQEVLLKRDIQDAFVIDLQNKRYWRANDLLLEESDGLYLKAADITLRALLRRVSGGLYRGFNKNVLLDWKYIEFLRGDPEAVSAGAGYHHRIARLPQGEIAHLVEGLPYLHAAELVLLLPEQLAADVMELMSPERQLQVFEELDEAYALQVIEKMAPDIAADLIGLLKPDSARRYLDHLPKPAGERIVDLLRYPEDSVGGIMTNDVIALPAHLTVAEARERLRKQLQEPDFVYFLYVVEDDEYQILRGVVTLRGILVARDNQRLEEIMNPYLETLSPLDSPGHSAFQLINSQLAALPVVSNEGRLLGVVTVDAAIRQVAPASWRYQAPRIFS
jgi:CBS domain-containing protein